MQSSGSFDDLQAEKVQVFTRDYGPPFSIGKSMFAFFPKNKVTTNLFTPILSVAEW